MTVTQWGDAVYLHELAELKLAVSREMDAVQLGEAPTLGLIVAKERVMAARHDYRQEWERRHRG